MAITARSQAWALGLGNLTTNVSLDDDENAIDINVDDDATNINANNNATDTIDIDTNANDAINIDDNANDTIDIDVNANDANANDAIDVDDTFVNFDIFDPRNWDSLDSKMIDIILSNGEKCDRDWLVYSLELDKDHVQQRRWNIIFLQKLESPLTLPRSYQAQGPRHPQW
ncbi:hypothetical protein L6452_16707 [Arctium lappa]|uniref:Uncharacterized protein n=1 Tax=Arctium lappa TaxID=4217 RepID=A0ACB9C1K8_ARCLA|nr:hypothetical protein L6452_16707 [Arctium lappa]